MFDRIAEMIDLILKDNPNANFHLCGDFNVHHKQWLIHSNKTDKEGSHLYDFSIAYNLTQIVKEPTRVPDRPNEFPSLLDLFITSIPDKYSPFVSSPLGFDHSVVHAKSNLNGRNLLMLLFNENLSI